MAGSRVQFLYGSSVYDLKLDFLQVASSEDILAKVTQIVPDLRSEQLCFVFCDDDTPVTQLRIEDQQDLQLLQNYVKELQIAEVFFQCDSSGRQKGIKASQFFNKEAVLDPALSKSRSIEESKAAVLVAENPVPVVPALREVTLPFALALRRGEELKTSFKLRDFTILSDSSLFEPEKVPLNSTYTRTWKLMVSGSQWTHAAVVCLKGREAGAQFSVRQSGKDLDVEMRLQMTEDPVSLAFRIALDGECCGPLLWAEVFAVPEPTVEDRLSELGAQPHEIEQLKQLIVIGLNDLPKLMRAWKSTYYKDMDTVANIYYSYEDVV